PPLLDVPGSAVGRGVEVLELLVGVGQGVAREQERVRDIVVELLVDGVERLLASGLAAVGAVSVVEKRLVDLRVRVEDVVELVLAGLARVPDRVRIRVGPERPTDDEAFVVGAGLRAVEERVERLEQRIDLDADVLVLLLRELEDRLADVVSLIRLDAHLHRRTVGPAVDAVRAHLRSSLLWWLLRIFDGLWIVADASELVCWAIHWI